MSEEVSLQEACRRFHARECSVEEILDFMNEGGTSILLNGSTDDGHWECSWITGGVRYTGARTTMRDSIQECLNKCFTAMMLNLAGQEPR